MMLTINKRITDIDIVRGLVMIIMALDHVRDLMHVTALIQSPTNLTTTTPALFLARWITYLCAPTFVFLSGASVWLATRSIRKMNSTFLLKRGLWLIALEFTVINFALWFDFQFRILMLQVIAAIGVGFMVLSVLLKESPKTIGILSAVIFILHNLVQLLPPTENGFLSILRNLLFTPGILQVSPGFIFFIAYPIVPWLAIMMFGYSVGWIFEESVGPRNRILLTAGCSLLGLFIAVRLLNVNGDPLPWQIQQNSVMTILSFLNVSKYPPSVLFISLFLGIMFLLLRFAHRLPNTLQNILSVFGRVPLFYYLLHLVLIRLSVFIMVFAQGYRWEDLLFGPFQFGRPLTGSGIDLWAIILVWILIVALLYPLCKWYGDYKKKHLEKWWLKYL